MEIVISDPADLQHEVVPQLLEFAGSIRRVALYGEIGSGKTTLVKALCSYFGVEDNVSSPTFSLINEYSYAVNGGTKPIYHLDLYRLRDLREAQDIGLEDYLDQDEFWCFIEWPELVEDWLPSDTLRVKINVLPDSRRKIVLL